MEFDQDPALRLGFENIDTSDSENVILHIDGFFDKGYCDFEKESNKKYFCLDFELPNNFGVESRKLATVNIYEKKYDKIFTICPYTAKIRNKILEKNVYEYVYYPSPKSWNRENNKEIDICYFGSNSDLILNDSILNYNHLVVNRNGGKYCNKHNVSFDEKMEIISKSKITIVHNILFFKGVADQNFFEVRNKLLGTNIITQHKSRVIEAARCKSLMLCREDDFNIIEDFFTPNEDFLYYNNDNLSEILNNVLTNYEDFKFIVENAYEKVNNKYDIKNFYKDYILKYE